MPTSTRSPFSTPPSIGPVRYTGVSKAIVGAEQRERGAGRQQLRRRARREELLGVQAEHHLLRIEVVRRDTERRVHELRSRVDLGDLGRETLRAGAASRTTRAAPRRAQRHECACSFARSRSPENLARPSRRCACRDRSSRRRSRAPTRCRSEIPSAFRTSRCPAARRSRRSSRRPSCRRRSCRDWRDACASPASRSSCAPPRAA